MKFIVQREKVDDRWTVSVMKEIASLCFENEADSWAAINLAMHTLNGIDERNEVELYNEEKQKK